jgi:histidyl-tRNA synthetase
MRQAGHPGLPFVLHRADLPAPFACTGRSAIRLASINLCAQFLRLGGARQHNLHMAKNNKDAKPEPRLPKGLRDIEAAELRQQQDMLGKIRAVYERYGFEPLETPAFEYTDALGKFLPDQDRPNEGVFSLQDEDEQWLSLRYDLTAPLARYVAQDYQTLPKPFRRYAVGNVWRNEKPGPGRFRQFMQFDADTVGAESVAADAEMCMLAADTLEALGVKRGDYVIKVNSRKILDALMEALGLSGDANSLRRLTVLRALDKFDRLGWPGVEALLGAGRIDESGDRTVGAKLDARQILMVRQFLSQEIADYSDVSAIAVARPDGLESLADSQAYSEALTELLRIREFCNAAGYGPDRVRRDLSVIRGLEYYTGPVFEAELTFEVKDEKGQPVRFGSVGGGGRYDDLVARFTGQKVPATGFSIGVSRLQAALAHLNKDKAPAAEGPVIVTVMEKEHIAAYQKLVQRLRQPDDGGEPIRAELYLGNPKKFGKQLEYADKRGSPCVVIQGSNERDANPPQVILKDMIEGAKAAAAIADNKEWKETRPAQVSIKEADLVAEVRKILARHAP